MLWSLLLILQFRLLLVLLEALVLLAVNELIFYFFFLKLRSLL